MKALRHLLTALTVVLFILAAVWAIVHEDVRPTPAGTPVEVGVEVRCSRCGKTTLGVFTCQDCGAERMCLDCMTDHACTPCEDLGIPAAEPAREAER